MLALVGPRANGRTHKLVQWAIGSGGKIVVSNMQRAEHLRGMGVPEDQICTVAKIRDMGFVGKNSTLWAIDDLDDVLRELLPAMDTSPQLVTFHGGAMQP